MKINVKFNKTRDRKLPFRGVRFLESGYVFAPYIPPMVTSVRFSFKPRLKWKKQKLYSKSELKLENRLLIYNLMVYLNL